MVSGEYCPRSAEEWHQLLQDRQALLKAPIAHHRELLHQAYALRDRHAVDAVTLGEMLEHADAALAYAREALVDVQEGGGPCRR